MIVAPLAVATTASLQNYCINNARLCKSNCVLKVHDVTDNISGDSIQELQQPRDPTDKTGKEPN